MREKDIKILWGRSGNRCALCKLELTPDGTPDTLGEMVHIVARSPDGPRGAVQLPNEERETYENLILLCPNHHSEVDKNPDAWPIHRLKVAKADHERWVSERLQLGQIAVQPVDNSGFVGARRQEWASLAQGQVALAVSVSPLRAVMDTLNPLDDRIVQLLQSARIPNGYGRGLEVNRYDTRPTARGVANDDFREHGDRFGHHIEVFRVGHCEYVCELARSVRQITDAVREENPRFNGLCIIRYTDVAQLVEFGMLWLWNLWHSVLPFTYMTLTVRLINTANTTLFSRDKLFGYPLSEGAVEYSEIVDKQTDVTPVLFRALERLTHSYGLVLAGVRDTAGQYTRPEKMS